MNFIIGLLVGLFLGWMIKWLIDEYYRPSAKLQPRTSEIEAAHSAELYERLVLAESKISQLEWHLSDDFERREKLVKAEAEISRLRAMMIGYEQESQEHRSSYYPM